MRITSTLCLTSLLLMLASSANAAETIPAVRTKLSYFGFSLIDCTIDDPHDKLAKSNYIDEVAGFTNIGQLCVFSPEEPLTARLEAFTKARVKALLYVEGLFFESKPDSALASGVRLSLRTDAAARWAQFSRLNKSHLTSDHIAAFQMVDEPAWHELPPADFIKALRMIKADYPKLPVASVEAYTALDHAIVPKQLDWIGFDRYNPKNPQDDQEWLADFEKLKNSRTRPSQKIFIVANTQWIPSFADAGLKPKDMGPINVGYFNIAQSTPDVVALIGYAWPGGLDGKSRLGARSLPASVQSIFHQIGRRVLGTR
jgi:hypothetical protein